MDPSVFFGIPPQILKSVFGWDVKQINLQLEQLLKSVSVKNVSRYADTESPLFEDMFANICEFLFEHLTHHYPYITTNNPFSNWKRNRPHNSKQFELGRFRRSVPDFALKFRYPSQTIENGRRTKPVYTVNGYSSDSGAYSSVLNFVVWDNQICVLKQMEEDRQPDDDDDDDDSMGVDDEPRHTTDMYELVIQTFLNYYCTASHIKIPKLHFVQRQGNHTHACMERLSGKFLQELTGDELLIALAHVMKALFVLQREYGFLHRDFHGGNVSFDRSTYQVGIIDFGMACINPNKHDIAWQQNNIWFYPVVEHSKTARCLNCSLDVCMIVASESENNPFLLQEHQQMQKEMKKILETSSSFAKREMEHDFDVQYTKIYRNRPIKVGNLLTKTDQKHWWLYNTAEFEMIQWDPRSMLSRLLYHIPIREWFPLRHDFPDFDSFVPKNIIVEHSSGIRGLLTHVSDNFIHIRQFNGTTSKHSDAAITVSPNVLTIGQKIVVQNKQGQIYNGIVSDTRMGTENDSITVIANTAGKSWTPTTIQLTEIRQFH